MNDFLNKIKNHRITVGIVGDSMVDEYYYVDVGKISPEYPIPVMVSEYSDPRVSLPGGAANVAYQFQNLNADVYLMSFVDSESDKIFKNYKINTSLCEKISIDIPRKRRFYSNNFPTYRWDIEKRYSSFDSWEKIKRKFDSCGIEFDILIFSDYDKGFFIEPVVDYFSKYDKCKYKIVDPKKNLYFWKNYDLIKPNSLEAKNLTGHTVLEKQYDFIKEITNAKEVIITLGSEGVYSKNFTYKPQNVNLSPNSVIGAGDCFMAFLATALSHNYTYQEASKIAFEMGALYVQEKHNMPLNIERMLKFFDKEKSKFFEPVLPRDYSLCFTNGCFDILHRGHIETLKFAKSKAEKLVVAVNSDESISNLKPNRPVNKLKDRMSVLANLECVDYVVSFSENTPLELIKKLRPDVLVKGGDYSIDNVIGNSIVDKVYIAPYYEGLSTTSILNSLVY